MLLDMSGTGPGPQSMDLRDASPPPLFSPSKLGRRVGWLRAGASASAAAASPIDLRGGLAGAFAFETGG